MKGEEGGAGHAAISGTGIRAEPGAAGAKALRRGQTDVSEMPLRTEQSRGDGRREG